MGLVHNQRVVICRSNPIAPDPRVTKTALSLSHDGYRVSLLGWDRTGSLSNHEIAKGITHFRLSIRAEYGTGLGNLSALLRWQLGLLSWLIRHRDEYDLIHACDFDTILPPLFLKRFMGKKVIYDIFDFYADHLRATPKWIKNAIRFIDKKCIGWADAVILADDARWAQIAGSKPNRSTIIYNTPPDIRDDLRLVESSQNEIMSLVYVGLLQRERGIFEILSILQRHPEWHLDLAGFGGDEDQIAKIAIKMPNVKWHGRIPYEEALQLSNSADIIFATYDPAIKNNRYASPNKVFEAMMLGKPIIAARNTNVDKIIENYACGLVINYGDVAELEKALTTLNGDPGLRSKMGRNARRAYEQEFNWSQMETRLIDLYMSVL